MSGQIFCRLFFCEKCESGGVHDAAFTFCGQMSQRLCPAGQLEQIV